MDDETSARLTLTELLAARKAGDYDRAITLGDRVWNMFGQSRDVAVARVVATATVYSGISLFRTNRGAQAAKVFDRVITGYGDSSDPELQGIVKDARDMRRQCSEAQQ